MPTIIEILTTIEEEEKSNVKSLSEKYKVPQQVLEKLLSDLAEHNIVEYNKEKGEVKLSSWLTNINESIEEIKPSIATIILPKNQKIKIEDLSFENFLDIDMEINMKLRGRSIEIAICNLEGEY